MTTFICPECSKTNEVCSEVLSLKKDGSVAEYFYAYCDHCYYRSVSCEDMEDLEQEIAEDRLEWIDKNV